MREKLKELVENTIIFKYELPNFEHDIERTCISTQNDGCYFCNDNKDLVNIIYNSVIEYSYESFPDNLEILQNMHSAALCNKLKYSEQNENETELQYGFFGEVLLCSFLVALYGKDSFIARGRFFEPMEDSETKGYDCYHIFENNNQTELWFGEVKFHQSHNNAINSVMNSINKALSCEYLERTFYSIDNKIEAIKPNADLIIEMLLNWKFNGINIIDQVKKYNMKLVYPILLVYGANTKGYESNITKVINYIKTNYDNFVCDLDIPYSIFFILLPINEVKDVKDEVIKWIKEKKPLLL